MKNYKGGYLLISLGMVALASITALPSGTVEKIKASSKRIVLTDISLDGVKQENDITVQPIISGTSVIIKGVYGKDITIASDNSVTISNSQSSGTQLYAHHLKGLTAYLGSDIYIISDVSEPITDLGQYKLLNAISYYFLGGGASKHTKPYPFFTVKDDSMLVFAPIDVSVSGEPGSETYSMSFGTCYISSGTFTEDEVTPL